MQPRPLTEAGADPARFTWAAAGAERGTLLFENCDIGQFDGVELVGHFAVGGVGWLIVTDCDCPYEETVFLHLLDAGLRPLERCTLGGAYTAGIVEGMDVIGPGRFRLLFPSSDTPQLITIEKRSSGLLGMATRWIHVSPG